MIKEQRLIEYYLLKEQQRQLSQKLDQMREEIMKELEQYQDKTFVGEAYTASIQYNHEVTADFIAFLRKTGNEAYIQESSTCKAYQEIKDKYNLTAEEKQRFCVINPVPRLIVKKSSDAGI